MSQEDVEIVRSGYEAFARGDIEGVLEIMDPEVEWAPALAPLLGVEPVRGKHALRKFQSGWPRYIGCHRWSSSTRMIP